MVAVATTAPAASTISTVQPGRRRSPLSSWRATGPDSNQAVPAIDALACTTAGSRQALCRMAASHTGKASAVPASKAARSAALGARAGSSPPPSTSTRFCSGDRASASAFTRNVAVIGAAVAPAGSTVLLVQRKAVSPAAPVQAQPAPVGAAASAMPASSLSLTV